MLGWTKRKGRLIDRYVDGYLFEVDGMTMTAVGTRWDGRKRKGRLIDR